MKRSEKLYEIMGQIDEKYVEEAENYAGSEAPALKRGGTARRILVAAAVLAVAAALAVTAAMGMHKPRGNAGVTHGNVISEVEKGKEPDLSDVIWLGTSGENSEMSYPEGADLSPKTYENGKVRFPHGEGWTLYYALEKADDNDRFAVIVSRGDGGILPQDETHSTHETNICKITEGLYAQFQDYYQKQLDITARIRRERNVSRAEAEKRLLTDPEYLELWNRHHEEALETNRKVGEYVLDINRDAYDFLRGHCDAIVSTVADAGEGGYRYLDREQGYCIAVMTKAQIRDLDTGEYGYSLKGAQEGYEEYFGYNVINDDDEILSDDSCLTPYLVRAYEEAGDEPIKVNVLIALPELEPENVDELFDYPSDIFLQRAAEHYGMTLDEFYLLSDDELQREIRNYANNMSTEEYDKVRESLFREGELISGWGNNNVAMLTYERALELSARKEVYMISYADLRPEELTTWSETSY